MKTITINLCGEQFELTPHFFLYGVKDFMDEDMTITHKPPREIGAATMLMGCF